MAQKVVNGINVGELARTIKAVRERPELGRFQFRARQRWLGGGHARTTIKDFYGAGAEDTSRTAEFVLESDEPAVLLGSDHAPNATEALLHALASCLGATFVYHAAARGVAIESLRLELAGDLDLQGFLGIDDRVRPGFQRIDVTFYVASDAPRARIEELCRLAQRYSPVFDSVTHGVPVSVALGPGEPPQVEAEPSAPAGL